MIMVLQVAGVMAAWLRFQISGSGFESLVACQVIYLVSSVDQNSGVLGRVSGVRISHEVPTKEYGMWFIIAWAMTGVLFLSKLIGLPFMASVSWWTVFLPVPAYIACVILVSVLAAAIGTLLYAVSKK